MKMGVEQVLCIMDKNGVFLRLGQEVGVEDSLRGQTLGEM